MENTYDLTLDRCTDQKQLRKLVKKDLANIRSAAVRGMLRDFIRLYSRQKEFSLIHQAVAVGIVYISRRELEDIETLGDKLNIRCAGVLVLDKDIPHQLALRTIDSIRCMGLLICPRGLKSQLASRTSYVYLDYGEPALQAEEQLQKHKDRFLKNNPLRVF